MNLAIAQGSHAYAKTRATEELKGSRGHYRASLCGVLARAARAAGDTQAILHWHEEAERALPRDALRCCWTAMVLLSDFGRVDACLAKLHEARHRQRISDAAWFQLGQIEALCRLRQGGVSDAADLMLRSLDIQDWTAATLMHHSAAFELISSGEALAQCEAYVTKLELLIPKAIRTRDADRRRLMEGQRQMLEAIVLKMRRQMGIGRSGEQWSQ